MTESDYFLRLEMRVTQELACMRRKEFRGMWCDGFIPESFTVVGTRCRINGRVWLAWGSQQQECWDFVLLLGDKTLVRERVDWEKMLPPEDVMGWMSLDFKTKFMTVRPSAAVSDQLPQTFDEAVSALLAALGPANRAALQSTEDIDEIDLWYLGAWVRAKFDLWSLDSRPLFDQPGVTLGDEEKDLAAGFNYSHPDDVSVNIIKAAWKHCGRVIRGDL